MPTPELRELSEIEILALTIYGEARGESIEGQVAVGSVIRNRKSNRDSYHDICLKREQFSCWNSTDSNVGLLNGMAEILLRNQNITNTHYMQCFWVAEGIIKNLIKDNTNDAKNYLTNDLFHNNRPSWAKNLRAAPKEIGNQTFFSV